MKKSSLTLKDLQMFKRFRIPSALVRAARIVRVTDAQARERGIRGRSGQNMSGIAFPYLNPVTGEVLTNRVRRDKPEMKDGKPEGKYMCPPGSERALYFTPHAGKMLEDSSIPLVLLEAEKSALALKAWSERTGYKLLAVAMGGCWGWLQNNGEGKPSTPLADLNVCRGRVVYIMLDANAATNDKVQAAQIALVKELLKLNSTILIATVPQLGDVNGPDDLVALPDGDKRIKELLESAVVPSIAPYSEDNMALTFTETCGQDWLYVSAWGKWMHWNGKYWRPDETEEIKDQIRLVCRKVASKCPNPAGAQRIGSAKTVGAVELLARADRKHAATVDQWDSNPWLLNTSGGVVDLLTGSSRPAERTDYCTKTAKTTPEGACPKWKRFLGQITGGNKNLQSYLQRVCGYVLTGDTREHALFFCYGTSANGKSVFASTISGILGEYAQSAPIETFTATRNERHPTDVTGLHGARLVTVTETEEGGRWAEAKLKQMTGGDRISARYIGRDFFQFTPRFKLLFFGNHRPHLRTVDVAMQRRINLIPFTVTFAPEHQDKGLGNSLKEEWPGILRWAIEGCIEWKRNGLKPPLIVTQATENYLKAEDSFGLWLAERTQPDSNGRDTFDVDGIGTAFGLDLENTTSEDITLPKDVRIMQSDKSTGSLADSSLAVPKDYFLPAKHTVAITIQNPNECIKSMRTDECFNAIFKDVGEIVIFDQSAKREIRFSVPSFSGRKDGAPRFISTD